MTMPPTFDAETLAFYARESGPYAARFHGDHATRIDAFARLLPPNATILELGCGAGGDTLALRARGFTVTATDGSPAMAAEAERRTGAPVAVMRFDALDRDAAFAGVWANACLLHVPDAGLPDVLARICRALVPGGIFYSSWKTGTGPDRDRLGRYYNYPSETRLRSAFATAGAWRRLDTDTTQGAGYTGDPATWLHVLAEKAG
jgi:SAM-dependent methyltransferase